MRTMTNTKKKSQMIHEYFPILCVYLYVANVCMELEQVHSSNIIVLSLQSLGIVFQYLL